MRRAHHAWVEEARWLAICRLYLHNFDHVRTSVLTRNEAAMEGLRSAALERMTRPAPGDPSKPDDATAIIYRGVRRVS